MKNQSYLENPLIQELLDLQIVDPDSIIEFHPCVRDREDVQVLKCKQSGLLFLNRIDHLATSYYESKPGTSYWSSSDREAGLKETFEDDHRRFAQIKKHIENKSYADVGSGLGGILDLCKPFAKSIRAVEPQKEIRENLSALGYATFSSIDALEKSGEKFDFITLFHVFEHISNPLKSLKKLRNCLNPEGKIFIEVPHANDALIKTFNLETFKNFTFWSEHLILHTRKSLSMYLESAGFKKSKVEGFQRYPLANHLNWLHKGEPGGHLKMIDWRDENLEKEYSLLLDRLDQTDTIIATAEV